MISCERVYAGHPMHSRNGKQRERPWLRGNALGNFETGIALSILFLIVNDEPSAPIGVPFLVEIGDERDAAEGGAWMIRGHIGFIGIIIGGQAYPMELFPGYEVSSSFFDGVVNEYSPSLPEVVLGVSGMAISVLLVAFALKVLNFLPESLADSVADPHAK